jgi:hypothetical protein
MACNGEGKLVEKFFMQLDGKPERYNKKSACVPDWFDRGIISVAKIQTVN